MTLGSVDTVLFCLVVIGAVGSGAFQGWAEQEHKGGSGLAIPRGRGPIFDFLYMMILTCSVPFALGKCIELVYYLK